MNLPIYTVFAWCAWRGVRDSRNPHAGAVDLAGSALFALSLAFGIWALITQADGWADWRTETRLAASAALFCQPRFVAAVLAMFGYAACAQVMMTFLPLYLQNAFGLPAMRAGIGMLPFAVAMIVGPHIGAALGRRMPGMLLLSLGRATIGAGNLLTAWFAGLSNYALLAIGMIVTGIGADVLSGDTQKVIMACVPTHRTGMASCISTTTRFTAIVTSVGVLGALLDAAFLSRVLAGDLAHAGAATGTGAAAIVEIARASFATGFSAALTVADVRVLSVALAVWLLGGRAAERAIVKISASGDRAA